MTAIVRQVEASLLEPLRFHWGFSELLPHQVPAMEPVLAGQDSLVVLPTGGGKSLCYQLPAVAREQLAIVVSPLLALMQDQVANLQVLGVPAAALNSDMTPEARRDVAQAAREGHLRLLYLSPEALGNPGIRQFIESLPVAYSVVDEAHCISQWGHDYRESYRGLAVLRELAPGKPIHAFTATATPAVCQDIVHSLGLREPAVIIGSLHRPNLTFRVAYRHDTTAQIEEVLRRHRGEAGLIYAQTRKQVERLAEALGKRGHHARAYHAGMDPTLRRQILQDFREERLDLVVATVAFGMGIDRADVRFVIHAGLPRSVEQYVQEAGRAGRDRLDAECVLLHNASDIATWQRMLTAEDPALAQHQLAQLRTMIRYSRTLTCRQDVLLRHFGQDPPVEACGRCDVCLGEQAVHPESTLLVQKVLSAVGRIKPPHGGQMIADVLVGKRHQALVDKGFDRLPVHGLLREESVEHVRDWIDQLVGHGLVKVHPEHGTMTVAASAALVLAGERAVPLGVAGRSRPTLGSRRPDGPASLGPHEQELFMVLKAWRRQRAQEAAQPAYCIMSDASLQEMARLRPRSETDLARIRGVGERRAARYGAELLELLQRRAATLPAS
ncbi:MAG: RecQ family ATP-dependent DNA helicase [Candidatus Sericytochromatia bacterium]|nr:RecQ family ATP-dependent DNA helicase [Candidatus Sericytochromatia bacterium]